MLLPLDGELGGAEVSIIVVGKVAAAVGDVTSGAAAATENDRFSKNYEITVALSIYRCLPYLGGLRQIRRTA